MVLLGRNFSAQKQTALFDIRLKGSEHDVLVIKGAPNDAPSILLSGTIVLSVLEPMPIKKLNLKLYATLRLKWTNSYGTQRGTQIKKPYRYERTVFEQNWDNFEIQSYFGNLSENYNNKSPIISKSNSANSSSSSLKSFAKRSKSSSNIASFGSSTSLSQSASHILAQGNYEFPFSTILSGSSLESVEGLPGASLVYKLQANIEKGRFSNDLIAKKHLRIIRTLTPDAIELSETMAVDNTWPKKVEYTISIPQRAVAIGSLSPIHMLFVPLCKGLKLGKVKVSLIEYFACHGSYGPPHNGDRTIVEIQIPELNIEITDDKWEINTHLQIPASLTKCTQDVDVLDNIKVRHKLKFAISLINPDGHISELRASLPVILFISPFVAVGVRNFDRKDSVTDPIAAFAEISSDIENEHGDDDDVIFAPDPDFTPAMATSQTNLRDAGIERQAPPNYENHIYDRLWNEILVEDTPEGSRSQTPAPGTPNGINNGESISGGNIGQLTENLKKLHIQRLGEQNKPLLDSLTSTSTQLSCSGRAGFTLGGDDDEEDEFIPIGVPKDIAIPLETPVNNLGNQGQEQDYFSIKPHDNTHGASSAPTNIISPSYTPGFNHISRVNSGAFMLNDHNSFSLKDWNSADMAKVPSYQTAMRSPVFDDFAPAYAPNDDPELIRPKSIHLKASSLSNSRAQSTARLSNLRGTDYSQSLDNIVSSNLRLKSSSANSSPSISRNASSNILNNYSFPVNNNQPMKSPSKAKFTSNTLPFGGMTPLPPSAPRSVSHSRSESLHSNNPLSLTANSRSNSFVNMMSGFMHKKKAKE